MKLHPVSLKTPPEGKRLSSRRREGCRAKPLHLHGPEQPGLKAHRIPLGADYLSSCLVKGDRDLSSREWKAVQEEIVLKPIGPELPMPLPTLGLEALFPEASGFSCTKRAMSLLPQGDKVLQSHIHSAPSHPNRWSTCKGELFTGW